jgi:hypothetical protein
MLPRLKQTQRFLIFARCLISPANYRKYSRTDASPIAVREPCVWESSQCKRMGQVTRFLVRA